MGHSELGSRWLREQSQLANRMPRLRLGGRRYDSDDEGMNSDDEPAISNSFRTRGT
jgi:hypothetical protein